MPHALTGEAPYTQRCHFGAAIAIPWRGDKGSHPLPPAMPEVTE